MTTVRLPDWPWQTARFEVNEQRIILTGVEM
jgi:hypothetical protein